MAGAERDLDPVLWELELQKRQPLLEAEGGQETWLGVTLPSTHWSSASAYHYPKLANWIGTLRNVVCCRKVEK